MLIPFFADGGHMTFLPEIVVLLLSCVVIIYLCQRIHVVPIVAFLLTGVLLKSLGLVQDTERVNTLAEVGVMLLLFTIGMEFSLDELIRMLRVILIAGGIQVGLTILLTTLLLSYLNVPWPAGVFTGCLFALSSDALTLKILSDRGETATPAGQATVAVLVFQDLIAVPMILIVPMLGTPAEGESSAGVWGILWALVKAVGTIIAVLLVARRLLPRLLEVVARTCLPELFLLTVTAICFGTAWLTNLAGVDIALGAFLAGLVISGSRLKDLAFGEVLPMRTLFSAAFFVSLGMLLDPWFLLKRPDLVLGAVGLILALRLITTAVGLGVLGTSPRVIVVSGLLMSQVGEFSFVLQQAGKKVGLSAAGWNEDGAQAFIAASVLMMALTPAFAQLAWLLDSVLRHRNDKAGSSHHIPTHGIALDRHLIIAGYGTAARPLARMLHAAGVPFGILTLNPGGATEASNEGFVARLGDSTKSHGLQMMAIDRAKMLVCADDDPTTARRIAAVARTLNPTLAIVIRTARVSAVDTLLESGADGVIAEEMEGIVQLFVRVLDGYLVPREEVARHVETLRSHGYAALRPGKAGPLTGLSCTGLDGECLDVRKVLIRPGVALVGSTLDEAALTTRFGLEVLSIHRFDEVTPDPPGDWLIQVGDRIVLRGSTAQFAESASAFRRPQEQDVLLTETTDDAPQDIITPPVGTCAHSDQIRPVTPQTQGCEECLALGQRWVHLRICMTCGHVGCCDSSVGKHATAHYQSTTHPIIRSLEPGETWGWCYVDKLTL